MLRAATATALLLLALPPLSACAARGGSRITETSPIPLQEGATLVPHLSPDGRQGLVVEARQPDTGADLLMTMLPRSAGRTGWDAVGIQGPDGALAPSLDLRGRSAALARAKVGGIPSTLLFLAAPDPADPVPLGQPVRMVVQALRLSETGSGARFEPLTGQTTTRRYCAPSDAIAVFARMPADGTTGDDRCRS